MIDITCIITTPFTDTLFGYHLEVGVYDIRHEKTEEYA